jgi:hypothetical protein
MKGVNFELNNGFGEFFYSILQREGLGKLVVKRKDISANGYKESSKIGYYRDDLTIDFQYKQANMFLRRNISSIQLLPLLEDMMLPLGVNADALDAWLGIFNSVPDIGIIKPKQNNVPRVRETTYFVNEGGVLKMKVKKITDSPVAGQIPSTPAMINFK